MEDDLVLFGVLVSRGPYLRVIRIEHAHEAFPDRIVRPNERVATLQIDVVRDGNKLARSNL